MLGNPGIPGYAQNINNLSVNVLKERRWTTRVNLHAAQIFAQQEQHLKRIKKRN